VTVPSMSYCVPTHIQSRDQLVEYFVKQLSILLKDGLETVWCTIGLMYDLLQTGQSPLRLTQGCRIIGSGGLDGVPKDT
jgi:hypothetical protein